jgi:hypothetical protein
MAHPARIAPLLLCLVFVTSLALADVETDAEGYTPMRDVDKGKTHGLDSADTGRTDSLDSLDKGRTHSLDSTDDGRTHTLDAADDGRTDRLDSADTGRTDTLDKAESERGEWQPPPCDSIQVDLVAVPAGSDPNLWADRLRSAQREIQASERALKQADAEYARSLNFSDALGERREAIIQAREEARRSLGQSRCALPALVDRAREAGVTPAIYRPYLGAPASPTVD